MRISHRECAGYDRAIRSALAEGTMWIHWIPVVAVVMYTAVRVLINFYDKPVGTGPDLVTGGSRAPRLPADQA
jgi:hypothetical protein